MKIHLFCHKRLDRGFASCTVLGSFATQPALLAKLFFKSRSGRFRFSLTNLRKTKIALDEAELSRLCDRLSSLTRAFFESLLYVIVGFTVNFFIANYIICSLRTFTKKVVHIKIQN